MDFIKQYITQSITAASNSLRLSTHQIEIVALLKESINSSKDLSNELISMKKITELSTLAIKLNEIYTYLTQNPLDLIRVSDQFKDHSRNLIRDLSHLLDVTTPSAFKLALSKLHTPNFHQEGEIKVDLSKRKSETDLFIKSETERLKEKIILEDDFNDEEILIHNFEENILKPIKPIDVMLKNLVKNEYDFEEMVKFIEIMKANSEFSTKMGFEIISKMHDTIAKTLTHIKNRNLMPGKEIVEGLRACLIVIVAVVKGKEVDITSYLNRADELEHTLLKLKT